MELTRTCCFEFDQKPREGDKRLFLFTCCFYFRLAWFTHLSPLPEVAKAIVNAVAPQNKKQLHSFLGLSEYMSTFVNPYMR